ncbi:hypothetical protein [Ruminococcus sp.]|uniref:hypothetical protein n=1 Tax=Ruminococcus sp. TaxID=41978 RepID=UPI003F0EEFAD
MKTNLKRMAALLLAVIICLNIAACSNAPSWDGKWEITDADYQNMKIAEVISTENDGTRYVTLSAEDISYKSEVKSDSVRVVAYPVSKADIESLSTKDTAQSSEELFKETLIDGVTVQRKDDKTLELNFKEPEYDYYCMYLYYVHKEAVDGKSFVLGFDNICLEESTTPEAKITTKLKNGQENPTLELKLTNAKAAENIKAEDITLSGAFENLKATSVTSKGDTIKIKTEGEVEVTSAAYGYVQLSESATDAGAKILAMLEVDNLDAYIDAKTFALENGLLNFDVDVYGKKLDISDDELAPLVTLEGYKVDSVKISDDKTSFRLYVKTDKSSLNDAVSALNGKALEIDSKAVGGDGIYVEITASCSSLGGVIKSLDKPEGNSDKFKATAQLFARSGELKELSKSDIKFSGDFEGAEVTSVKNTDSGCDIEFTFSADKDSTLFNGYAEISEGRLVDLWGTESDNNSAGLSYAFETSKAGGNPIDNLVEKFSNYSSEDLINDIVNIATIIQSTTLSEFYSGDFVGAIFSLLGVDSGSDGDTAEILSIVTDIKTMVNNLDCEIKDLKKTVEEYGDEIIAESKKNTLIALESKWSAFNTNYVERLDKTVNSYISNCRRSLVDYIRSEHGNELKLYYDTEGKLAIPDKNNSSYSVDAKKLDKSKTVTIKLDDDTFKACDDVFGKKGFKYSNELVKALKTDLGNAVKRMNENGDKSIEYTEKTGDILYGYIYMQMSFKNLTNDFMNNIRSDYVNFCKQIYEGQAILNTFDEMMKYKYNFQSEAKQDMENIRKSLVVMLYNYGITASLVEKYDTSTDDKEITKANHKAIDYIKNNDSLYDEPEGYSYCYVVNRPITLRVSGTGYNMRIKTWDKNNGRYKTDKWGYNGYEDNGTDPYVYRYDYIDERVEEFLTAGAPMRWRIPAGYYISADRMDKINLFSNNILSSKDLKIIKARFNSLKSSNRFASYKDMSFGEYMTNGKLINATSKYMVHQVESAVNRSAIKPTKILTSGVLEKEMPLDGSRTLVCSKAGLASGFTKVGSKWYDYGGGYYFTPEKKYSLINPESSDYDRKASKEYFHIHKEYDATVYDFETDSMKDNYIVLQAALYGQSSIWKVECDEGAYFYNTNYQEPYFIFPIG